MSARLPVVDDASCEERGVSVLRSLYTYATFYFALVILGSCQLAWALPAFLLRHVLPPAPAQAIGRQVIHRVFRHFFQLTTRLGLLRVDATALDALDPREPMIIAANHPSVLDALILISRLDNLNCIMKASVLDNVLLGSGARLAGYISNDGVKTMMRMAIADLRRGGQLIIFPEGTRTLTAPVNEFKCGFAAIARLARVPVQSVIIETDTPFLSKGWPVLKKPARTPMTFRVRLGRRFDVGDDINAFVGGLRDYFVDELADADLGDLRRRALPVDAPAPVDAVSGEASPVATAPGAHRIASVVSAAGGGDGAVPSTTHLVLIPSYDAGPALVETVRGARAHWGPVWVVIDGSTDGSERAVIELARIDPGVRVQVLPVNQGKGAAVFAGLVAARAAGYSHVLTMDSDGQHPADRIVDFMRASQVRPDAMILGRPVFDASAPALRVKGRRVSNWWSMLETLCFDRDRGIGDSLFGFRVYPVGPLFAIMERTRWMRRFDFDTEAVVRLAWRGVPPVNVDAAVTYPDPEAGGVSHFKYVRDNALLTWMHTRLMIGFVLRLPVLLLRKARGDAP